MSGYLPKVHFRINACVYLKDPESSELGRKIVSNAIELIDSDGFEALTFKKLAEQIGSTEASVYRYFESKHKLLLYLTIWYWTWMSYRVTFSMANIESAERRLENAIQKLTEEVEEDGDFEHINEVKLSKLVIEESIKAMHTRQVDSENREGVFMVYKDLVQQLSDLVLELNPTFKYPHMLISTMIEGAHHQRYFAEHLPRLTDVVKGEDAVIEFYKSLVFKTIEGK